MENKNQIVCYKQTFYGYIMQHPGTMMSPSMTRALKNDVVRNPIRKQALEQMMKDTPLTYESKALKDVNIAFGGKGQGHDELTKDGEQAYRAALLFWVTDNKQYLGMVLKILDAWATKNKTFVGDNAPLEAAWSICSMARAAELIRHTPEWQQSTIPVSFFRWIDQRIMPHLTNANVWKWKFRNNWHFSILCARMQLAILRDNKTEFDWVVDTYRICLPQAICQGHPCHTSETLRDLTHVQFLLGGIIQIAEMAYHQGVTDLYDPKLHNVLEYHASLLLKEIPPGISPVDIRAPYGYWNEPIWELAMVHFRDRKGMAMPKTEKNAARSRPEKVTFHWGGGSLTHHRM